MVEEEKIIITGSSNMMVGTTTKGFEPPYHHVHDSFFFNFEQQHNPSSDLFWKPTTSSSAASKAPAGDFCQLEEEDQSRSCVLINPNERPSQGLSLSLSSTNPSTIGIQSFLTTPPPQNPHHHHQAATYNSSAKSMYMHIDDHMIMTHDHEPPAVAAADDEFFRKPGDSIMDSTGSGVVKYQSAPLYNLRSSRYLLPAQHLLNEFCNLGSKQNTHSITKAKAQVTNQPQDHDHNDINIATASSKTIPLNSIEYMELQKRKTKLLQMLDEVDRKYHNYCDKMKAVVLSFEAVAGNGAATVYSTLASKAMSRHFRCLRDGVAGQIKATKKAMGEKDISTGPGATATRGETPRLKLLDQTLRQQRAFHQMITMDSHPWRPQRGLPERSVSVLRAWLFEHFLHPYPSDVDKHILARQTGLSRSQVSNWFINARVRLWKPMVEEMYMEETKDHENVEDKFNAHVTDENTAIPKMEQKPSIDDQLIIRNDSDPLNISSFISHHDHHTAKTLEHDAINQSFSSRVSADSFGTVELDFSTYNRNFDVNGGGVSLNLGLQQHASGGRSEDGGGGGGGGGSSLYYPRESFDQDCQTAVLEYNSSVLEGDQIQGQNLPYRNNLIEAQLLHDLAG